MPWLSNMWSVPAVDVTDAARSGRGSQPHNRKWTRLPLAVTAATAFTCTLLITRTTVHAQSLSGITLQPIENPDTLITDLIDHFAGGGRRDPKPVIDRVVVKKDT
jgi:hypothetical protein